MNALYKLLVFSAFLFSSFVFSQNADPGIGILMTPESLIQGGNTGILQATVGNYGNSTIVRNSLQVTITVGSNAEILGMASISDARWTQQTLTIGSANTIVLKNTNGGFSPFDVGDILLNIRGNVVGGLNIITGNIAYINANNSLLCGVCPPIPMNSSQGNASTSNDNSQTSLIVTPPVINAVEDSLTAVNGVAPTVITNDTLNGVPAVIGSNQGDVVLTSTPTPFLSINPTTGVITVAPNTPAGTYPISYTICEVTNPINCDMASITITVLAPSIVAVMDTTASVNGTIGGVTSDLTDNDTLNGFPVVLGSEHGNVVLTHGTLPSGLTFNSNGTITIAPNTPVGVYPITYTICEVTNQANCDTVTSNIVVITSDFTPTIDIDDIVFLTAGASKDFVVNISNISTGASIGQVNFIIPKQSGFTISYNATATLSNIDGGTIVHNNDWIFTENSSFISVTLKSNFLINPSSFSSIGFTITRKPNIPNQTWQPITATILNSSGSDSVNDNNTYNVVVKAQ